MEIDKEGMKRIFKKKLLDVAGVDEVKKMDVWQDGKKVYCFAHLGGSGLDSTSLKDWEYGEIDYWRVDYNPPKKFQIKFHLTEHPLYDEMSEEKEDEREH